VKEKISRRSKEYQLFVLTRRHCRGKLRPKGLQKTTHRSGLGGYRRPSAITFGQGGDAYSTFA
jgi:hypothetical protein